MVKEPEVNFTGGKALKHDEVRGTIEFRDVTFEYPTKADVKVAQNLTFEV
jgi:ABC-type multidrug transport system fused ATPase/permease subunit